MPIVCLCVFQGDANRSESDDEKKSENSEEDEKVEQLRDNGGFNDRKDIHFNSNSADFPL